MITSKGQRGTPGGLGDGCCKVTNQPQNIGIDSVLCQGPRNPDYPDTLTLSFISMKFLTYSLNFCVLSAPRLPCVCACASVCVCVCACTFMHAHVHEEGQGGGTG